MGMLEQSDAPKTIEQQMAEEQAKREARKARVQVASQPPIYRGVKSSEESWLDKNRAQINFKKGPQSR